jgi:hypothetical protein
MFDKAYRDRSFLTAVSVVALPFTVHLLALCTCNVLFTIQLAPRSPLNLSVENNDETQTSRATLCLCSPYSSISIVALSLPVLM